MYVGGTGVVAREGFRAGGRVGRWLCAAGGWTREVLVVDNVRKALRINAEYRAAESANPPAAP